MASREEIKDKDGVWLVVNRLNGLPPRCRDLTQVDFSLKFN